MLPFGGLALALFGGWIMPGRLLAEEIGLSPHIARSLQVLLRFIVPACIVFVALFPLFAAKG
jgi:SNF family Na+-dependent transporter